MGGCEEGDWVRREDESSNPPAATIGAVLFGGVVTRQRARRPFKGRRVNEKAWRSQTRRRRRGVRRLCSRCPADGHRS